MRCSRPRLTSYPVPITQQRIQGSPLRCRVGWKGSEVYRKAFRLISLFPTSLPCPAWLLAGFDRLQEAPLLLLQCLDLTAPVGSFLASLGSLLAGLVTLGLRHGESFGGPESLLGGGLALLLLRLTDVGQFRAGLDSILVGQVKFGPQVGGAAFDLDGALLGNGGRFSATSVAFRVSSIRCASSVVRCCSAWYLAVSSSIRRLAASSSAAWVS